VGDSGRASSPDWDGILGLSGLGGERSGSFGAESQMTDVRLAMLA